MRALRWLIVVSLAACGGGSKTIAEPKSSIEKPSAAPKVMSPSRWVMPTPKSTWSRKLPDGTVLHLGWLGERWIESKDDPSPRITLSPETMVGATVDGSDVRFVSINGAIYRADGVLGAMRDRRWPSATLHDVTAGARAIVALDRIDLVRSFDGGITWKKSPIDVGQGMLASVATTPVGVAAALSTEGKLFLSEDDGATWSELAPPAGVAVDTLGLRDGVIGIVGAVHRGEPDRAPIEVVAAELRLTPVRWEMVPTETAYAPPKLINPEVTHERGAMVGARWIEITDTALIEETLTDPPTRVRRELPCRDVKVAASGSTEVITCDPSIVRLWASPRATIAMTTAPVIRRSSEEPFHPMSIDPSTQLLDVEFDGDRVYATDGMTLFTSRDGGVVFERRALTSELSEIDRASIAFDESGVRAIALESHKTWVILTSNGDGFTATRPPFARAIAFSGAHGMMLGVSDVFETSDAGVTFRKVSAPKVDDDANLVCGSHGCVVGALTRIGWDDTPDFPAPVETTKHVETARPLRCKVVGKRAGPITSVRNPEGYSLAALAELGGKSRWILPTEESGRSPAVVVGVRTGDGIKLEKHTLLSGNQVASNPLGVSLGGVVAMRASEPNAKTGSIEIGWWDAAASRVRHATIRGLPSGSEGIAYTPSAEGLYVQASGSGIHFVRIDGSIEKSWVPHEGVVFRDVVRASGAPLFVTDKRIFAVESQGASRLLVLPSFAEETQLIGARAIVSFEESSSFPARTYAIELDSDAPAKRLPTQADFTDPPTACGAASPSSIRMVLPAGFGTRYPVLLEKAPIGGLERTLYTERALVDVDGGKACVRVYDAYSIGPMAIMRALIPIADLAHATLIEKQPMTDETYVYPMSCAFGAVAELPAALKNRPEFSE